MKALIVANKLENQYSDWITEEAVNKLREQHALILELTQAVNMAVDAWGQPFIPTVRINEILSRAKEI